MTASFLTTREWPALDRLFQHARRSITIEDVERFVNNGPWTEGTQNHWRELVESGQLRRRSSRRYTAVVGDMIDGVGDGQYRRFRVVASSVGLLLIADRGDSEIVQPLNHLVLRFLQDEVELNDPTLSELLRNALEALYAKLRTPPIREEQAVFCLVAIILLEQE